MVSRLKKILLLVCIILICLVVFLFALDLYIGDRPGTARNVQVNIGVSERFTQEEIESATELVISEFRFINSELTELWYDEESSNLEIGRSTMDLNMNDTIILFSTVVVSEPGGPGFLSPGILGNLGWVLVRDAQSGEWELITSGFSGMHF